MKPLAAGSGLGQRVVVGALLAMVAVALIWLGGTAFALLVAVGAGVMFHEWCAMQGMGATWRWAGLAALGGTVLIAALGWAIEALLLLGAAALLLAVLQQVRARAQGDGRWLAVGLLYVGLPVVALIWLRGLPDGFFLLLWTMGIVWATDIFAFFAGRAIGGAKIWPAISPNKSWAGLFGGMAAAALFSALFAARAGWPQSFLLFAFAGALLAIVAQAGDFFESWLKRRAGVKDSGTLLPGHGGVLDRVDGLVPVACVVALIVAGRAPLVQAASLPGFAA